MVIFLFYDCIQSYFNEYEQKIRYRYAAIRPKDDKDILWKICKTGILIIEQATCRRYQSVPFEKLQRRSISQAIAQCNLWLQQNC